MPEFEEGRCSRCGHLIDYMEPRWVDYSPDINEDDLVTEIGLVFTCTDCKPPPEDDQ